MPHLLNFIYLLFLAFISPWLIYKTFTTGKYRRGLWRKFIGQSLLRDGDEPCIWFHGVSLGEIHLLRQVVAAFQMRHPDWDCVISTTTDTGYEEACKRFPDLHVFYWPFDFTWAVRRALRRVKPSLVVLAEGELWPNFLTAANDRGVPVAVINARLSPRSLQRYAKISWLAPRVLGSIDLVAAQTEDYADAFRRLGVFADRIHVTGSVKYDGVETNRANPKTQALARVLGLELSNQKSRRGGEGEGGRGGDRPPLTIHHSPLIWIAGSTQDPEEQIVLDIYRRMQKEFPGFRLFLVPRQRERFDQVARLLERSGLPFLRRSQLVSGELVSHEWSSPAAHSSNDHSPLTTHHSPVVLVDTIGELNALWGLADVAFVGGSLDGRRGGQNMIEPAAYGAAVIFGPHVWNFRDTADRLVASGGAIQIQDASKLETITRHLLHDAKERQRLGANARAFVLMQQGATERTIACLDTLLEPALKRAA